MRKFPSIAILGVLALDPVEAAVAIPQLWANHTTQHASQTQSTPDPMASEPNLYLHTVSTGKEHKNGQAPEGSVLQSNPTSGLGESQTTEEPMTPAPTKEWTWGTDFIPWTKPPCPITRKCSEVCEGWESCTSNHKIITNYFTDISTITRDIYVLEPWTKDLVATTSTSWVGPGASYFIDERAPPRRIECPVDDQTSKVSTCSQTVTMTMLIWTIDVGEITYLWDSVISYHPTTSCPSRGFTITKTSTQTSTYTETTFESYYTTLTKWITVFKDAIQDLPAMPQTTIAQVTEGAAHFSSPAQPNASSTQLKTSGHVVREAHSHHLQRRQMGIGLPTLGFDDDISSGWEDDDDTKTCGPYWTTYTIDFHTVVTVLTSSVPIVVTKEEYTTKTNEQSFGTLANPTTSTQRADPTHIQEPSTPTPARLLPVPTNTPFIGETSLPWPLRVTTAPAGVGLVLPDGNSIPIGSVTDFSGFRISVPVPFRGSPLTAVVINGELFRLPTLGTSGKESIQIQSLPLPVTRLIELLGKVGPLLFFADGKILEPGGTMMFSNHKIAFSEDASIIEVDGVPIKFSLPIIRDGVVVGAIVMFPDGSRVVVTLKSEFEGNSQLWSSILEISSQTSSMTAMNKPFGVEIVTTKSDGSAIRPAPSSTHLHSGDRLNTTSLRGTAPPGDIPLWRPLICIIGLLL